MPKKPAPKRMKVGEKKKSPSLPKLGLPKGGMFGGKIKKKSGKTKF